MKGSTWVWAALNPHAGKTIDKSLWSDRFEIAGEVHSLLEGFVSNQLEVQDDFPPPKEIRLEDPGPKRPPNRYPIVFFKIKNEIEQANPIPRFARHSIEHPLADRQVGKQLKPQALQHDERPCMNLSGIAFVVVGLQLRHLPVVQVDLVDPLVISRLQHIRNPLAPELPSEKDMRLDRQPHRRAFFPSAPGKY
jgi:hypothetical protein